MSFQSFLGSNLHYEYVVILRQYSFYIGFEDSLKFKLFSAHSALDSEARCPMNDLSVSRRAGLKSMVLRGG